VKTHDELAYLFYSSTF